MTRDRFLTVKQPWAALIMAGQKDVENRPKPVPSTLPQFRRCTTCDATWHDAAPGGHRPCPGLPDRPGAWSEATSDGPFPFTLWIHAGKGYDHTCGDDMDLELHAATAELRGDLWCNPHKLRGVLLGHVTVNGCHHANECLRHTQSDPYVDNTSRIVCCSPWAQRDAYHWTLADPVALPQPIPMKGMLGLPFLSDDVRAAALAQLEGATA